MFGKFCWDEGARDGTTPGVVTCTIWHHQEYGNDCVSVGRVISNSSEGALFPLPVSYGHCYRFP